MTRKCPWLAAIISIYNEPATILELLGKVPPRPEVDEVILIDDFSPDATRDLLHGIDPRERLRTIFHGSNHGKGAAVRGGDPVGTQDFVFIQDADLGYDPAGYPHLLEAIYSSYADVVLGPRFLGGSHRVLYFWHYLANRLLTLLSHVFRGLNLTDMKARHKAVRRGLLARMNFSSDQFGIEPELTAKAARLQARIHSRRQQNWLERWSFRHILIIPG